MPRPKSKQVELPASTQRLQEIVEESGLTIAQFAERIGMTPSGFGGVFLRGAEVSGLQARAVELEFGISHRWILTGEGSRHTRHRELTIGQQMVLEMADPNITSMRLWLSLTAFAGSQREKALHVVGGTAKTTIQSSPLWERFQKDQQFSVQVEMDCRDLLQQMDAVDLHPAEELHGDSPFINLEPATFQLLWVKVFASDLLDTWDREWSHLSEKQLASVEEFVQMALSSIQQASDCFESTTYGVAYAKMAFKKEGISDFDAEKRLTAEQIDQLWKDKVSVRELIQQIKKR